MSSKLAGKIAVITGGNSGIAPSAWKSFAVASPINYVFSFHQDIFFWFQG